jgi:hypothetical protein
VSRYTNPEDFARQAQAPRPGFLSQFLYFLGHNKKWWLAPILVVLVILGGLVIIGGTAAAPFIYTLF